MKDTWLSLKDKKKWLKNNKKRREASKKARFSVVEIN
jgi:hypothetical protein